jgi:hypothetical protein
VKQASFGMLFSTYRATTLRGPRIAFDLPVSHTVTKIDASNRNLTG